MVTQCPKMIRSNRIIKKLDFAAKVLYIINIKYLNCCVHVKTM